MTVSRQKVVALKGLNTIFLRQRSELFLIAYARIVQNYFARREL